MFSLHLCSFKAFTLLAVTLLSKPITAAPHHAALVHRHVSPAHSLITLGPESLAKRAPPPKIGDLLRFSDEKLKATAQTCSSGPWQLPLNDGVPNPVDVAKPEQLDLFQRPESTSNQVTLNNYCSYDLYWFHFNPAGEVDHGFLPAGGSVSRPLTGSVMKVSKENADDPRSTR